MMTASLARTVRPLRISCLALAAGLALAACEEQPVGSFKNAAFVADGSRARQDLYFQPGAAALRAGEANRLRAFIGAQLLTPPTHILVHVGTTGSPLHS